MPEGHPLELAIAQLKHFLNVVDCGSFREAAARAHRSQPALSLSIKELEQRLGQRLFQRTKPPQLTPIAQDFLPVVRDLVAAYDRACESLARLAGGQSGSLSVASVMTATTNWLSEIVPEFTRKYPAVSVRVVDDNSANIEKMVAAGSIDFGICSQVTENALFAFEPLARDAFGLVCRNDHPLARRRRVQWDALQGQPLVGTTTHRSLDLRAHAVPLAHPAIYVENISAVLALLARGTHITVLPALAVPPYATGLTFVRLVNPTAERELGILTLRGGAPRPPAAAMLAMLRARAKTQGTPTHVGAKRAARRSGGRAKR
jgi:DNA-binding transcriptional LysR family regulator